MILLSLVMASVCLLAGHMFGYFVDCQYRSNKKLKRITIADKYRWLFWFQWAVGGEVNCIGFHGELVAYFASALLLLIGLVSAIVPLDSYITICFWVFIAFGYVILTLAIILVIWDVITRPQCKRCLQCEIHRFLHPIPHFYTVLVETGLGKEKGEEYYLISFGKIFVSRFKATAESHFSPTIGMHAKAIYKSTPPYFHLVSRTENIE